MFPFLGDFEVTSVAQMLTTFVIAASCLRTCVWFGH